MIVIFEIVTLFPRSNSSHGDAEGESHFDWQVLTGRKKYLLALSELEPQERIAGLRLYVSRHLLDARLEMCWYPFLSCFH